MARQRVRISLDDLRAKAKKGMPWAQHYLAEMCATGDKTPVGQVQQDFLEAARWYRKAANQGLSESQWELGWMYLLGEGVTKNVKLGLRWIHKAALDRKKGPYRGIALRILGQAYEQGLFGLRVSLRRALKWHRTGAADGDPVCMYRLGLLYMAKREVSQKTKTDGLKWIRKAAALGSREARTFLRHGRKPDSA